MLLEADGLGESVIQPKSDFSVRDHDSVQIQYRSLGANEEGRTATGPPLFRSIDAAAARQDA
jgi:hypothetical protein